MKIYTKIILDNNNNILEENSYEYNGPIGLCGIHYNFASQKGQKLMEKKAKRLAKEGPKKDDNKDKALDASKPITLDFLTNPNKE